jgi:hypothetical protein
MLKAAALIILGTVIATVPPAQAAVSDGTPYYLCFAYTQDGMLFAGGDDNLKRAGRLMAANCNMPKTVTVVLLQTVMVRRGGKIYRYAARER